ncbi:MAG: hypothetical protein [Agile wallaby adenovirus 1]|nr:MAG: hypothetical protein [Agile wallaby atadenovirus 1]
MVVTWQASLHGIYTNVGTSIPKNLQEFHRTTKTGFKVFSNSSHYVLNVTSTEYTCFKCIINIFPSVATEKIMCLQPQVTSTTLTTTNVLSRASTVLSKASKLKCLLIILYNYAIIILKNEEFN